MSPLLSSGKNLDQPRRALWVVRDAITTKSKIDEVISTAIKLNISDIFFQIRALGEVYYDSKWEAKSGHIEEDFDPLTYAIELSHQKGIRVHAWINMFYVWAGDQFPENKGHIINKRAEFVLRKDKFPDYISLRKQGYEGFFLDPKASVVQRDLLNLLKEVADHYNIAGLHLDYFRYPGISFSFTADSRTKYMLDSIYDPWYVYNTAANYVEKRGYEVFLRADKEYRRTLIESLNDYLSMISDTVKNKHPQIELSVAVKPDPVTAKHRYFQDWPTWLKKGYCDFVAIMNYRTDWNEFDAVLNHVSDRDLKDSVIVGVSTYNQDVAAVIKRLEAIRTAGFAGFSLFSYNYLQQHKIYLKNLLPILNAGRSNGS
jgi:uncharacterized lipoprotein YddW (UPF0748 family)